LLTILGTTLARVVFVSVLLESMFTFGFLAFLPSILLSQFGLQPAYGGAVMAVFGLGGLAFSRFSPYVLGRWSRSAQARAGGTLLALAFALLGWGPHWATAIAACLIAGFAFYTLHNTLQFSATQLSTTSRGMAMSLFACALFLGQSIGVLLAAQMFSHLGPHWSYAIAGAALGIVGLGFAHQLRQWEEVPDI
jgi:predicted MFS family arabinose efflux permease